MSTVWGIHMEWDDGSGSPDSKDVAIGWHEMGDLRFIQPTREAMKVAFSKAFPNEKAGAVPVKAGVLYRFLTDIKLGDIIVYPSKFDRVVNIGLVQSGYDFSSTPNPEHPHRRRVAWKIHLPRANFSQTALYEIGSAITLFQISNNADEFRAALDGTPFQTADVDIVSGGEVAAQAQESVEDFVIKRLKNTLSPRQFEEFTAGLLEAMGFHARATRYGGDGGVDIIAHRDELGFEPPVIKVQCKQTLQSIGGPAVQQLLGAVQASEHALFVTLGEFSSDAIRIERGKSNLRLIGGADLVQLVFNNYERLDPRFKSLVPLKRSYAPSLISTESQGSK